MASRLLFVFFSMLTWSGSVRAEAALAGAPIQLALTNTLSIGFVVPPGWAAQGKPLMPGKAAQIEMVAMTGKHKLKVSVLVPQGKDIAAEAQAKMLEAMLAPKVAGSVEDKVSVVTRTTENASLVYATLTDKALVGQPVPRGQWRAVTQGMSKLEGFVTTMSLYSQETDDPGHAHALAAWEAMTGTQGQALLERSFPTPGDGGPLVFSAPAMHMMEVIHGPPPADMVFKEGAPPATRVQARRADGLSLTLETSEVSEAPGKVSPVWV